MDPVQQKAVWSRDHKAMYNGGLLSTASGLVFQGTGDGHFYIYDAETGDVLHEIALNTGVMAAPVTYRVDGEQYVAIAAGTGGGIALWAGPVARQVEQRPNAQVLVFKLGGNAQMLPETPPLSEPVVLTRTSISDEEMARGKLNFAIHCAACHGVDAVSGLVVPDLRYMSQHTFDVFDDIIQGGLAGNGMPDFSAKLSIEEQEEIKQYVAQRNEDLRGELSRK